MQRKKRFMYFAFIISLLFVAGSITVNAAPKVGEGLNIAPTIDLSVTPVKKPVDVVILTDYKGTKLSSLNTRINALKAQLNGVNADPVFHIVSDVKKVGVQKDEIYNFRRYGHFFYTVSSYMYKLNYGTEIDEAPWTLEEIEDWEVIQGLKSQVNNLPVRNPLNVYFTKSTLQTKKDADEYRKWYDVTIKCVNDPSKIDDGVVKEYTYNRYLTTNSHEHIFGTIQAEWATIDKTWTMEEKVSDVSFDVYSFDYSKLSAVPLRTGSDRHLIFLSDASAKDYSQTIGNYFSFGDMTDTLKSYININEFSLYGVVPNDTRDRTLLADKVAEVLPLGNTTLFYLRNGKTLKPTTVFDNLIYPEFTEDIGEIKETIKTSSKVFLLMVDGTIKHYDSTTNAFTTIAGISNATKVYSFTNNSDLYVLDSAGKVFYVDNGKTVTPFNNSVVITNIYKIHPSYNVYITATGVPYMEYKAYNNNTKVWTKNLLTRARIKDSAGVIRYMPAIKDVEWFSARATVNRLYPSLFLYTTGQIQQFASIGTDRTVGTTDTYIPYLAENTATSILETGVASIESNNVCIFIFKTDGTVKMLNTDWVAATYEDDDDRKRSYIKPILKSTLVSVPLTNIRKTLNTGFDRFYFTDINNNTYMYNGTYQANAPVLGTTLKSMGNNINKIVTNSSFNYCGVFLLYNDGSVNLTKYRYITVSALEVYTAYTPATLPYTSIRDIFTSGQQTYLLTDDGNILEGSSSSSTVFTNPLPNNIVLDVPNTYLSLLDIFNQATNSVFYPAGGYATALNAIYNRYSSYSGTGNMYVVLGDDIKYESAYDDYESDPEYSRKWIISHDPYYFDNSMGLSQYHNPTGFTTNPPAKLDKVGKYAMNLKACDNPKADNRFDNYRLWSLGDQNLTVYVHRKPIALQRISVTNNGNGTFTVKALDAGSYDPDHTSRADKGIAEREWRWRKSTETIWHLGNMDEGNCTTDMSYVTQLRVKDLEGVWSDYNTINIDKRNPPVALFSMDKPIISTTESLKIKDQSFPRSISAITNWHWVIKKLNTDGSIPGTSIQNAQFTNSNTGTGSMYGYDKNVKYSYSGIGKYRVYLRVKDGNGLWSDGATDSIAPVDLDNYYSMDFEVDRPPTAGFTIAKTPIELGEFLKVRDTSYITGISAITRWHWIVKKLNGDGSVPSVNLQSAQFTNSNAGEGVLLGYDGNVITDYSSLGAGIYRIYLRVMNGNGMWSDRGTDSVINLGSFFYRDIVVEESFKVVNFRVVKVKDLHLESYYYNPATGQYDDKPMNVNTMAIDSLNFGEMVDGLTKGYLFDFEIDTINFDDDKDTIIITPHFYTCDSYLRDPEERDLYWENSFHEILEVGEGGHSAWATIELAVGNRIIKGDNKATWRGSYLIPGTAWAVPRGTAAANAGANRINRDIIVNFEIKGYKDGVMRYDYNLKQWPAERIISKQPYELGDVIRYSYRKCNLDDNNVILNRP